MVGVIGVVVGGGVGGSCGISISVVGVGVGLDGCGGCCGDVAVAAVVDNIVSVV